ncbi:MAG: monofunctional biosynthetic peptidoglycan transglycosylase [Longimicrobiales bacterium]|nr:monofunctional biosynthetic peptidoglycan transglycosylase [Longimicrobiales bacterium]
MRLTPRGVRRLRRAALVVVLLPVAYYQLCVIGIVYLRFFPPVATAVQLQRAVERSLDDREPIRRYRWRPIDEISRHLPHAVVAAEDARFYRHIGFDWEEVQDAVRESQRSGEPVRGASTLTHQLMKNLFFTTHRNPVRKLYEWGLTPVAHWILGRDRILELYVNVVEFGPGLFGAEAAARYYYETSAAALTREQAARLAAVLPDPLRRRPWAMDNYSAIIRERMRQLGW